MLLTAILIALWLSATHFQSIAPKPIDEQPIDVAKAYLQALEARDFVTVYRYLSSADQRVWNDSDYVQAQGAYSGFALQVAKTIAGLMEVWPIEQSSRDHRAQLKIAYRVPAAADLSNLVLNWDQEKLNALPPAQQSQLLETLVSRNKQGKVLTIQGQENFELTREANGWKVFLDWASGTKVKLRAELPKSGELEVRFAQTEIIAKEDDLFLVNLIVRNHGDRAVTFAVQHKVDPRSLADNLEMVECGIRTPVLLQPRREQEFSMAYLLGAWARNEFREFSLTYEFNIR